MVRCESSVGGRSVEEAVASVRGCVREMVGGCARGVKGDGCGGCGRKRGRVVLGPKCQTTALCRNPMGLDFDRPKPVVPRICAHVPLCAKTC